MRTQLTTIAMMSVVAGSILTGCKGAGQCRAPATETTSDLSAAVEVKDNAAASDTTRGLRVGDRVPDVALASILGSDVQLGELVGSGPLILVFYRGGWCPYCAGDLKEWQGHLTEVDDLGGSLVAITPEAPNRAEATGAKNNLGFDILSDGTGEAAAAFDVGFTLDEKTQRKYAGYGIDLPTINAQQNWDLVIPATFVVDRAGVIRYAYVNEDYSKRADPQEVIAALRAVR